MARFSYATKDVDIARVILPRAPYRLGPRIPQGTRQARCRGRRGNAPKTFASQIAGPTIAAGEEIPWQTRRRWPSISKSSKRRESAPFWQVPWQHGGMVRLLPLRDDG